MLDVLRAMLDDIDMTIGEIKREAHDFKREIVIGAENPKTGKIIAEKLHWMLSKKPVVILQKKLQKKSMEKNQLLKLLLRKQNQLRSPGAKSSTRSAIVRLNTTRTQSKLELRIVEPLLKEDSSR